MKAELEIVLQFWADTKSCAIHRRQRCQELYNEVVSIEEEEEEEEEQIKKEINKKTYKYTKYLCGTADGTDDAPVTGARAAHSSMKVFT